MSVSGLIGFRMAFHKRIYLQQPLIIKKVFFDPPYYPASHSCCATHSVPDPAENGINSISHMFVNQSARNFAGVITIILESFSNRILLNWGHPVGPITQLRNPPIFKLFYSLR